MKGGCGGPPLFFCLPTSAQVLAAIHEPKVVVTATSEARIIAVPDQGCLAGAVLLRDPNQFAMQQWIFASATGGIVNSTTAVTIEAAAGAALRNYVQGCQLMTQALGRVTEFAIRDGARAPLSPRTHRRMVPQR